MAKTLAIITVSTTFSHQKNKQINAELLKTQEYADLNLSTWVFELLLLEYFTVINLDSLLFWEEEEEKKKEKHGQKVI